MPRNNRDGANRQESNNVKVGPIIFLLFLAAIFFGGDFVFALTRLAFLGFGLWLLYRVLRYANNFFSQPTQQGTYYRQHQPSSGVNLAEFTQIRQNANKAMQRAGRNPHDSPLHLNDIGLLIYEGSKQPQIYRTAEVGTDATHIRPFMVINNPDMHSTGQGTIRFNLIDEQGQLRFTNRSRYTVKPGQNFITPSTWLPLNDQDFAGKWTMQVNIGESTLFAIHEFNWFQVGGEVRAQFTGDGEIDELAYSYEPGESLSLDELLASQGEAAPLAIGSHR